MKTSALFAVALAAMRLKHALADVVVWETDVSWVDQNGNPIPAPKKEAAAVGGGGATPAPPPQTSSSAVPQQQNNGVNFNIKLAGHDGPIPTGQPLPTGNEPTHSSGGDSLCDPSGSFQEGTCNGPGLNIYWTGDVVNWVSNNHGSGKTQGCTNLGVFNEHIALETDQGTWLEVNMDNGVFFDVSLISGFSHPMVCSSEGQKSGCSIDLHSAGTCPQPSDSNENICINPVGMYGHKDPGGWTGQAPDAMPWCGTCSAPDPFFQHCSGAAYTYPYDDGATRKGSETLTCCIGTKCGCTGREGSTKQGNPQPNRPGGPCQLCPGNQYWARDNVSQPEVVKKDLEEVLQPAPKTPSLLPRKHKRHGHNHRHAHGHDS